MSPPNGHGYGSPMNAQYPTNSSNPSMNTREYRAKGQQQAQQQADEYRPKSPEGIAPTPDSSFTSPYSLNTLVGQNCVMTYELPKGMSMGNVGKSEFMFNRSSARPGNVFEQNPSTDPGSARRSSASSMRGGSGRQRGSGVPVQVPDTIDLTGDDDKEQIGGAVSGGGHVSHTASSMQAAPAGGPTSILQQAKQASRGRGTKQSDLDHTMTGGIKKGKKAGTKKSANEKARKKAEDAAARKRMMQQKAAAKQAEASGEYNDQQKAFNAAGLPAQPPPVPQTSTARPPMKKLTPIITPPSLANSGLALPGLPPKLPVWAAKEPKACGRPKKQGTAAGEGKPKSTARENAPQKKQPPETGDLGEIKKARDKRMAQRSAADRAATAAQESEDEHSGDEESDDDDGGVTRTYKDFAGVSHAYSSSPFRQLVQPKIRPVLIAKRAEMFLGGDDMPPIGAPETDIVLDGDLEDVEEWEEEKIRERDMETAEDKGEAFENVHQAVKRTVFLKKENAYCEVLGVTEEERSATKVGSKWKLKELAKVKRRMDECNDRILREEGFGDLKGHFKTVAHDLYDKEELPRPLPDERKVLNHGGVHKAYYGDPKVTLALQHLHYKKDTLCMAVEYDAFGGFNLQIRGSLEGTFYANQDVFDNEWDEVEVEEEEVEDAAEGGMEVNVGTTSDEVDVTGVSEQLPTPEESGNDSLSPDGASKKPIGAKRKRADEDSEDEDEAPSKRSKGIE